MAIADKPLSNERTESNVADRNLSERFLQLASSDSQIGLSSLRARSEKSTESLPQLEISRAKPDSRPQEWTVAIHLAASLPGNSDKPLGFGSDSKFKTLQNLAKDTEGKPVSYIVHVDRTVDRKGQFCRPDDPKSVAHKKIAACDEKAVQSHRAVTERYLIRDGKIEILPNSKAKTPAQGLTQLLKDAQEYSPSNKIGLIIQSHGQAEQGIETNKGKLSLNNTVKAIEAGLKGSGHNKLDMLNFDACIMGNDKVLEKTEKIARNVVASAAVEAANLKGDGQNLAAALHRLNENPYQDGGSLAKGFVERAADGHNGEGRDNTTYTLASFDTAKFGEYKQSLESFGKELGKVLSNKDNLKAIQNAVDETPVPESGAEPQKAHKRDIRSFAENVIKAIEAGKINGDSAALDSAARDLLKRFDEMTTARFGEKTRGYENVGGLTTHLAGSEILDSKHAAKLMSPFLGLENAMKESLSDGLKLSQKDQLLKGLDEMFKELKGPLGGHPAVLRSLKNARDLIAKADSDHDLTRQVTRMQHLAGELAESALGKKIVSELIYEVPRLRREYHRERPQAITPAWDHFVRKLEKAAK